MNHSMNIEYLKMYDKVNREKFLGNFNLKSRVTPSNPAQTLK